MLRQNIKRAYKLSVSTQAYHNRYLHREWGLLRVKPTPRVNIYLKPIWHQLNHICH